MSMWAELVGCAPIEEQPQHGRGEFLCVFYEQNGRTLVQGLIVAVLSRLVNVSTLEY